MSHQRRHMITLILLSTTVAIFPAVASAHGTGSHDTAPTEGRPEPQDTKPTERPPAGERPDAEKKPTDKAQPHHDDSASSTHPPERSHPAPAINAGTVSDASLLLIAAATFAALSLAVWAVGKLAYTRMGHW